MFWAPAFLNLNILLSCSFLSFENIMYWDILKNVSYQSSELAENSLSEFHGSSWIWTKSTKPTLNFCLFVKKRKRKKSLSISVQ